MGSKEGEGLDYATRVRLRKSNCHVVQGES